MIVLTVGKGERDQVIPIKFMMLIRAIAMHQQFVLCQTGLFCLTQQCVPPLELLVQKELALEISLSESLNLTLMRKGIALVERVCNARESNPVTLVTGIVYICLDVSFLGTYKDLDKNICATKVLR